MEHDVAWKKYDEADLEALEQLTAEYIDFISDNKTERECAAAAIALAEERGYRPLDEAVREGRALRAGDKVWAQAHGKALILAHLGSAPLAEGFNILGAHLDSPRLDLKQNPFSESNGLAHLDTHYYGGIKKYQWPTVPLALHGVVYRKDGSVITGPDIITRGFVYVKESESLMEELREVALEALDACQSRGIGDWATIKSAMKGEMSRYLYKKTKRNPMILPVIMEV